MKNRGTIDATSQTGLLTVVQKLAKTYAQLNPMREHGDPSGNIQEDGQMIRGFLDRLWNWTNFEDGRPTATQPIGTDTIGYLKAQLTGQSNIIGTLQFVDQLHQVRSISKNNRT